MRLLIGSSTLREKCGAILHDELQHSLYFKERKLTGYHMTNFLRTWNLQFLQKRWSPSFLNKNMVFYDIGKIFTWRVAENVPIERFEQTIYTILVYRYITIVWKPRHLQQNYFSPKWFNSHAKVLSRTASLDTTSGHIQGSQRMLDEVWYGYREDFSLT